MRKFNTPEFIKKLIIINVAIYFISFLISLLGFNLAKIFGLVPFLFLKHYYFWQIFTYMFMHGSALHIFFNMLMLWMFGIELYFFFGKKLFIKYYLICGLGAGLTVILLSSFASVSYYVPTVGASGAIFGLFLAYGWFFKDKVLYVFGIFPMKARPLVTILALIEFFTMFSQNNSAISHTAHIGGLITGFIYLKYKEKQKNQKKKEYLKWKEKNNNNEKDDVTWN